MKKNISLLLGAMFALVAIAAPAAITDEQISAAAVDPAALVSLLSTVPEYQVENIVLRVIVAIETSNLTPAQKSERIAQVVAAATKWAGERAPVVIAPVVGKISAPLLPVFSAAAVGAAGPSSRAMLTAMVHAVPDRPAASLAIRQAARGSLPAPVANLPAAAAPTIAPVAAPTAVIPLMAAPVSAAPLGTGTAPKLTSALSSPLVSPSLAAPVPAPLAAPSINLGPGTNQAPNTFPRPPPAPPRPPPAPYRGET